MSNITDEDFDTFEKNAINDDGAFDDDEEDEDAYPRDDEDEDEEADYDTDESGELSND